MRESTAVATEVDPDPNSSSGSNMSSIAPSEMIEVWNESTAHSDELMTKLRVEEKYSELRKEICAPAGERGKEYIGGCPKGETNASLTRTTRQQSADLGITNLSLSCRIEKRVCEKRHISQYAKLIASCGTK